MSADPTLAVDIIGDSGPFSRLGKSIGYRVRAGNAQFLIDCGAPVFQLLGPGGLDDVDGIIGTHAHEDHKRWFTDIALYQKFTTDSDKKINLMGSHRVLQDYRRASVAALERTLSADSREIVTFSFDDYIQSSLIAPEPKYQLTQTSVEGKGNAWRVVDHNGEIVRRDRARVFVEKGIDRPRFLLKDPDNGRWVEPSSYYSFDDPRFYNQESYEVFQHSSGLKITPVKATAWHGLPTTSLLFEFEGERVFFSSDTAYNPALWKELTQPKTPAKQLETDAPDSYIVEDDINDYNEQSWSETRLERALTFYQEELVMIHDVTGPWATVHTDYRHLEKREDPLLLTHSPDVFTSTHPLAHLDKTFEIKNSELREVTEEGDRFPLNADCYYKKFSHYYVGYKNPEGDHVLVRKGPGQYDVKKAGEVDPVKNGEYEIISRINLYEEIGGEYYPFLDKENEEYLRRPDGSVEQVSYHEQGSQGVRVENLRQKLSTRDGSPAETG